MTPFRYQARFWLQGVLPILQVPGYTHNYRVEVRGTRALCTPAVLSGADTPPAAVWSPLSARFSPISLVTTPTRSKSSPIRLTSMMMARGTSSFVILPGRGRSFPIQPSSSGLDISAVDLGTTSHKPSSRTESLQTPHCSFSSETAFQVRHPSLIAHPRIPSFSVLFD